VTLTGFKKGEGAIVLSVGLSLANVTTRFIEYFTREDARSAVRSLDGKRLGGRIVRVLDHEVKNPSV